MIKKFLPVVAGALALGACHSAPTRIYSLDVAAPAVRQKSFQATALRVDALSVPAGWDRIEILQPSAGGRLEIDDFDHWSAPLAQVARQALSADLSERLPPGILIYPRLPKPQGAAGVDVDILEFSVAGARASMQASWVITPAAAQAADPAAQTARRGEALLQCSMSSTETSAVVRAWSELIGQLADRIAADAALGTN
jgi:uncharacterized lipoprotein YmbA